MMEHTKVTKVRHQLRLWSGVAAGIIAALSCLCASMIWQASQAPIIRSLTVHVTGWPAKTRALRMVLLSDIHLSRPGDSPARLLTTVASINGLRPDIVLLAGDYIAKGISGARSFPAAVSIAPLSKLKAPMGIYAVLGNHDYRDEAAVRRAFAAAGIPVLDNRSVRAGPLAIVGIGDEFSRHARLGQALSSSREAGGFPVVLTHSPDVIPRLPPSIQLALAGHTHCGQISLPFIGPPVTMSRYGQRYACGVIREGGRTSVVTAGLGTSTWPIRLFVPPDAWIVTIGS